MALGLSHPALDGPVVMLVPEHSVEAKRVVWKGLGLTGRFETKVGARSHRPPEFLAAVLAHHPEGLEQAVALLPRLRTQSEVARTKTGRARKALDETADELTRTAPGLLPFFYDECAQILARVDPVESLAVALRGGVTDELFLPALEEMPAHPPSCFLEECGPDLCLVHETPRTGGVSAAEYLNHQAIGKYLPGKL